MRTTPALKLSTRLVAFVTMIVISAVFILFVGGTLSIQKLGEEYTKRSVQGIVEVLDQQIQASVADGELKRWVPKLLKSSNVIEMKLHSGSVVLFDYKDTARPFELERLVTYTSNLTLNPSYTIEFKVIPPYIGYSYSIGALSTITLAIGLIVFCLRQGVKWLRQQLRGSELLEERGRMILAGRVEQHAIGDHEEWPYTASEALDKLIAELQDARQERSRFDTFIRSQTFLDQLTGASNRLSFDNRLESTLTESGASGGIIVLQVYDWESIKEQNDKQTLDAFIVELGDTISNSINRYPDVVFARYYEATFCAMIPNQSDTDLSNLCSQILRQVEKLHLNGIDPDNWVHLGMTVYREGERRTNIVNEVETALKSAQLEKENNWNRFNKETKSSVDRGSVRWRALFDRELHADKIHLIKQPCFLAQENGEVEFLHHEVFSRIIDDKQHILKASKFSPAIRQTGYESQLDKNVLLKIVKFLKLSDDMVCYSINLYAQPFRYRTHFNWLRDELLQLTPQQRQRLAFEFMEGPMVTHLDAMRPVLKMLSGLGCKVIVNQAGRTIISSHYIKESSVDYLKLHRSLVRNIESRPENQLYIRSLLGACENTPTQVIAVGVETKKEWQTLLNLGISGGQGRFFAKESDFLPGSGYKIRQTMSSISGRRNRWRK
ncbi:MSHA biogenesis protein mshH [Vibrio ishigakensis]|uniref:MSHA biogenesis protein mshH n=1 Tax=Vibrio ishigakensis TaxID=1481914 RepID=A0A0B8NII9_9VIBR|nr:RNase E specificity factor CsrD [Vibrio ishigakensis]GAM54510.1 MSHA biogenesis protein mshH [Vibrio ishigakensis]